MYELSRRKDGKFYYPKWRQEKRGERKFVGDPVQAAYYEGQYSSAKENRYPPGKRHDAFEAGKAIDNEAQHHREANLNR